MYLKYTQTNRGYHITDQLLGAANYLAQLAVQLPIRTGSSGSTGALVLAQLAQELWLGIGRLTSEDIHTTQYIEVIMSKLLFLHILLIISVGVWMLSTKNLTYCTLK